MAIRNIRRQATNPGAIAGTPNAAPIYVDSDDNILKIIPAGSGTTEVQVIDATSTQTISGAKTFTGNVTLTDVTFEIGDNDLLTLGDDNDTVLVHKSATLNANTALTGVLIGTPVTQALAANSSIVSNVTASGDILVAANRGGASEEYFFADSSAGTLTLTGPGGIVSIESGTTEVLRVNSATVIEIPDNVQLTLGTDNDSVAVHKSTSTTANTAVTGAIVGTPVVPALAANSTIHSNVTADGDIVFITQTGGNSQAALFVDASANTLELYAAGVSKVKVDSTGLAATRSAEVVAATNADISAAESGRVYFLNAAGAFVSTLPAAALGLEYTFIVKTAPSGASYTVVTPAAAQIIAGHVLTSGFADSGSDVETTAGANSVNFVDGVAVAGDRAHFISDGTNWYVSAICAVEAGITITG